MKYLIPLLFLATTASASFSGYTYRRQLTISHLFVSSGSLIYSNFPVLVQETDLAISTASPGGHMSSAFDLVFSTMSDCSFLLNWDTETVNNTGVAQFNAFVNIPSISSSTDTPFYMCYGNSAITTYQGISTMTWTSNYKGVYHLADSSGTTAIRDSTFNLNIATNVANTNTKSTAGQIAGGMTYNGSSDFTIATQGHGLPVYSTSTAYSISFWMNSPVVSGGGAADMFSEAHSASTNAALQIQRNANGAANALIFLRNDAGTIFFNSVGSSLTVSNGNWNYVVWTDSSGVAALYVNGIQDSTNYNYTPSGAAVMLSDAFGVFYRNGAAVNDFYNGSLDEMRLMTGALTPSWIATEYTSQKSPASFVTYGREIGPLTLSGQMVIEGGKMTIRGGKVTIR